MCRAQAALDKVVTGNKDAVNAHASTQLELVEEDLKFSGVGELFDENEIIKSNIGEIVSRNDLIQLQRTDVVMKPLFELAKSEHSQREQNWYEVSHDVLVDNERNKITDVLDLKGVNELCEEKFERLSNVSEIVLNKEVMNDDVENVLRKSEVELKTYAGEKNELSFVKCNNVVSKFSSRNCVRYNKIEDAFTMEDVQGELLNLKECIVDDIPVVCSFLLDESRVAEMNRRCVEVDNASNEGVSMLLKTVEVDVDVRKVQDVVKKDLSISVSRKNWCVKEWHKGMLSEVNVKWKMLIVVHGFLKQSGEWQIYKLWSWRLWRCIALVLVQGTLEHAWMLIWLHVDMTGGCMSIDVVLVVHVRNGYSAWSVCLVLFQGLTYRKCLVLVLTKCSEECKVKVNLWNVEVVWLPICAQDTKESELLKEKSYVGVLDVYLQMTTRMRCQDRRNDGRGCRDRRVCSIRRNVTVLVFFMVVMMLYVDANGGTRKSMHEMRRGASGVMRLTGSTDLSCIRDATVFRESGSMESRVVTVHSGHSASTGKGELDA